MSEALIGMWHGFVFSFPITFVCFLVGYYVLGGKR